jgi:uncharacterized protein (TIGR03437 family)
MNILTLWIFVLCSIATAQGIISTIAGGSAAGGFVDNIPATQARLSPESLIFDRQGNLYLTDASRIRRIDGQTGLIATVAGSDSFSAASDGPASSVMIAPRSLATDPSGNILFISNHCVKKLDVKTSTVSTFLGPCDSFQNPLNSTFNLATDTAGNVFYADSGKNRIFRVDAATHAVTTFAGGGTGSSNGDNGPATSAVFSSPGPGALTVDPGGNVYVSDGFPNQIRKIDARTNIITSVASVAASALTTDAQGSVYISQPGAILRLDPATRTTTTISIPGRMDNPLGLAVSPVGELWIADGATKKIYALSTAGAIRIVAGTEANGDGGPAVGAIFDQITGLAVDPGGDIYVSDFSRIRRIDAITGMISTIAGGGLQPGIDQTPAVNARIFPGRLGLDPVGNVVFLEQGRIRRIRAGLLETIFPSGGLASAAAFAIDRNGNVFISDSAGYIRRLDAKTGTVATFAGNGNNGNSGDGGPALSASIGVVDLTVVPSGDLYLASTIPPNTVRRVNSAGIINTIAGNTGCEHAGDGGPPLLASVCQPNFLASDAEGNVFVVATRSDPYSEPGCRCVRRITADNRLIQTVAGGGDTDGDGVPAVSVTVFPVAIAASGDALYIAEGTRIRKVIRAVPPPLPVAPRTLSIGDYVSPGGIVTIKGNYLAPPDPALLALGPDGRVATQLNAVRVFFNDVPAPLIYVSPAQINAVVPYATATTGDGTIIVKSATIRVETLGGTASTDRVATLPAIPTIFPGAILNADGTLNDKNHPVTKGGTVVAYGTGMGQLSPAVPDGTVLSTPPLPTPLFPILAFIRPGGPNNQPPREATLAYLGPAPGVVAGVMQANVVIPPDSPAGPADILFTSTATLLTRSYRLGGPIFIQPNGAPPVVTSVDSASLFPLSGNQNLPVRGMNFDLGLTVDFFYNGAPLTTASSLDVRDNTGTSFVTSLNTQGKSGTFGIEVVNPNGTRSPRFSVTVK